MNRVPPAAASRHFFAQRSQSSVNNQKPLCQNGHDYINSPRPQCNSCSNQKLAYALRNRSSQRHNANNSLSLNQPSPQPNRTIHVSRSGSFSQPSTSRDASSMNRSQSQNSPTKGLNFPHLPFFRVQEVRLILILDML
jgi:hypothetical protein